MDKNSATLNYEVPRVEIIETEVEKGFEATGNNEPSGNNEPYGDKDW